MRGKCMQFLIKVLISALIVAGVATLARRYTIAAALLASLPLTSLLAIIWLYADTSDPRHARVANTRPMRNQNRASIPHPTAAAPTIPAGPVSPVPRSPLQTQTTGANRNAYPSKARSRSSWPAPPLTPGAGSGNSPHRSSYPPVPHGTTTNWRQTPPSSKPSAQKHATELSRRHLKIGLRSFFPRKTKK